MGGLVNQCLFLGGTFPLPKFLCACRHCGMPHTCSTFTQSELLKRVPAKIIALTSLLPRGHEPAKPTEAIISQLLRPAPQPCFVV